MKKIGLPVLLALGMTSGAAVAAGDSAEPLKASPFFKAGYAFGGEERSGLEYDDGSSSDISAGGGFTIGGGLRFPIQGLEIDQDVGVNLSAAYHGDSATASNAEITFDRFEFAIMPFVELNDKVTFAAGVEFHTGVEWSGEDDRSEFSVEYDASTAIAAELIFNTRSKNIQWSIKAALVDYSATDFDEEISGSNVGAFFYWSM